MASPTFIVPEELMFPQKKAEVVRLLKSLPLPGTLKRELLLGWAITVGVKVNRKTYAQVEETGIDF